MFLVQALYDNGRWKSERDENDNILFFDDMEAVESYIEAQETKYKGSHSYAFSWRVLSDEGEYYETWWLYEHYRTYETCKRDKRLQDGHNDYERILKVEAQ